MDITRDNNVERPCHRALDLFRRLDVLANSASIVSRKLAFELTSGQLNLIHETHVTGTLRYWLGADHNFREQHSGCVINVALISSFVGLPKVVVYSTAKNAVVGLSQSLANKWAKHGIRTNAIMPGFIPTNFNRTRIQNADHRRILEHTPWADAVPWKRSPTPRYSWPALRYPSSTDTPSSSTVFSWPAVSIIRWSPRPRVWGILPETWILNRDELRQYVGRLPA